MSPLEAVFQRGTVPPHPQQKRKKTLDTCRCVDPVCLRCRVWKEDVEYKCKGKEIPLQACTCPEGFRRLKLPDF
jgi:hypothetical protein